MRMQKVHRRSLIYIFGMAFVGTLLTFLAILGNVGIWFILAPTILVFPFSPFPIFMILILGVPLEMLVGHPWSEIIFLALLFTINVACAWAQLKFISGIRKDRHDRLQHAKR